MIDTDALRRMIDGWLVNIGPGSDLADLTDLGAIHYVVLDMLTEHIQGLSTVGYSKVEIHAALGGEAPQVQQRMTSH